MIAALYVDPLGPYPRMPGVDCWDETRDARLYDGPHPIVAHPPCGPWSKLRHMYKGAEHDCGPRAVEQVRKFGGVLEQPEHSTLFGHCGVSKVDLWTVQQVAWGHACVKPTWLYIVGIDPALVAAGLRQGGTPTHCVCTGPRQRERLPVAHAGLKRRTPPPVRSVARFTRGGTCSLKP